MRGSFLPTRKKKKRMSHFCPSSESEHCSKTGPTNTVLLPARQSGEEKWRNSHCNPTHPQPLQHSKLSHTLAWGAGQLPCACAELALTEVTKRDREGQKKENLQKIKLQSCPPASSCSAAIDPETTFIDVVTVLG